MREVKVANSFINANYFITIEIDVFGFIIINNSQTRIQKKKPSMDTKIVESDCKYCDYHQKKSFPHTKLNRVNIYVSIIIRRM